MLFVWIISKLDPKFGVWRDEISPFSPSKVMTNKSTSFVFIKFLLAHIEFLNNLVKTPFGSRKQQTTEEEKQAKFVQFFNLQTEQLSNHSFFGWNTCVREKKTGSVNFFLFFSFSKSGRPFCNTREFEMRIIIALKIFRPFLVCVCVCVLFVCKG